MKENSSTKIKEYFWKRSFGYGLDHVSIPYKNIIYYSAVESHNPFAYSSWNLASSNSVSPPQNPNRPKEYELALHLAGGVQSQTFYVAEDELNHFIFWFEEFHKG